MPDPAAEMPTTSTPSPVRNAAAAALFTAILGGFWIFTFGRMAAFLHKLGVPDFIFPYGLIAWPAGAACTLVAAIGVWQVMSRRPGVAVPVALLLNMIYPGIGLTLISGQMGKMDLEMGNASAAGFPPVPATASARPADDEAGDQVAGLSR
jgi:hypothetical protein